MVTDPRVKIDITEKTLDNMYLTPAVCACRFIFRPPGKRATETRARLSAYATPEAYILLVRTLPTKCQSLPFDPSLVITGKMTGSVFTLDACLQVAKSLYCLQMGGMRTPCQ